jgi:hypothetical protein
MPTLVWTVLWALKGTAKMEGRTVEGLNVDIRRHVIISTLVSTAN